jgi:hypothetical protein
MADHGEAVARELYSATWKSKEFLRLTISLAAAASKLVPSKVNIDFVINTNDV